DDINAYDLYTVTPGDSASFQVRGSSLTLFYVQTPIGATFSVSVDGQWVTSVNSYAASNASVGLVLPGSFSRSSHVVAVQHSGSAGQAMIMQGVDAVNPTGVVVDTYATPGQ